MSPSGGRTAGHLRSARHSFIEAVEEGRASARRGDLLGHDDVVERIEEMLRA